MPEKAGSDPVITGTYSAILSAQQFLPNYAANAGA